MEKNKRKDIRRDMRYNAWIGTGDSAPLRGCVVSDISDSGARLTVENPKALPDGFSLVLAAPGSVRRKCQIVWRSAKQVGVHFEKAAVKRPPPTKTARSARL